MDMEQIVRELKSLADNGTRVPGFRRKVMVEGDRLLAIAEKLQRTVPANVAEAGEIVKQKESLLNLAFMEAERIKGAAAEESAALTSAARQDYETRVGTSEVTKAAESKAEEVKEEAMYESQQIVQDSQRKAYRILNEAESAAISRRDGADNYAKEVLFNLEEQLAEVLGQVRRGIDALRIEVEASQKASHQIHQDLTKTSGNGKMQVGV